jgi:hypothetical protein
LTKVHPLPAALDIEMNDGSAANNIPAITKIISAAPIILGILLRSIYL